MTFTRRRYPLHITLAATFTAMFIVFGLTIILFDHSRSRRVALLGAEDQVQRISDHLRLSIAQLYQPAQALVDVAAETLDSSVSNLEERLKWLELFTEALQRNPALSAVFIGSEDGDFFLVRSLRDEEVARRQLNSPQGSIYAVQSLDHNEEGRLDSRLIFFDDDLHEIESRLLPDTDFDPRERGWFCSAMAAEAQITTGFYTFFTTQEVGLTTARKLRDGTGVIGVDLSFQDLSRRLTEQRVTPSSRIVAVNALGNIIAMSDPPVQDLPKSGDTGEVEMPHLAQLGDPVYSRLAEIIATGVDDRRFEITEGGREWLGALCPLPSRKAHGAILATLIPRDELLAEVIRARNQSLLISFALLLVAVLVVLRVSGDLSGSLRSLAREAEEIRHFRLSKPLTTRSRILEVDELAGTMGMMKSSIQQFFEISRALSAEKDAKRLMEMILREACKVSRADGGVILIHNEEESGLEIAVLENPKTGSHIGGTSGNPPPHAIVLLQSERNTPALPHLDSETARLGQTIAIDIQSSEPEFDISEIRRRFDSDDYRVRSILSVPLVDQQGDLVGLLQLVNARNAAGDTGAFDPEVVPFIEALSSNAAVALDLRRLLQAQKDLLESFTQVLAGAIDAKSPYTHGHCSRVPEVARLLAEAAGDADSGPFENFEMSEDEWHELHLASWLHDCGKVTTPEYVVDKATRLETIYNRVHEIRTRFELLWRDAEIEHWRRVALDSAVNDESMRRLEARISEIEEQWRFIAECNLGETFMDEERVEQLQKIGAQTWVRHLDDRIGLSHDEERRREQAPEVELPATETVLADRLDHIIERDGDGPVFGENPHGFTMDVPEYLYNRGELHNLSIRRGTLTAEERFKINEHIIRTIEMLKRMPFPRELRRVPEWAGNHHEKLDGTGYPRKLGAADLSIHERIMAIADIFEALTATDRPYHRSKTVSTALKIMGAMRSDGHLCPELFQLFLESGVYRAYADQHLKPEQIDDVDVAGLVER